MVYCDLNENILEWGSEEIAIPYRSPVDRKIHRYFPDFYVKLKETTGKIKKYIIEVKPKKQLKPPTKPKRKTKAKQNMVFRCSLGPHMAHGQPRGLGGPRGLDPQKVLDDVLFRTFCKYQCFDLRPILGSLNHTFGHLEL